MSESTDEYYKKIDEYLSRPFFDKVDRKVSFLTGSYYNYLAYLEKEKLKTTNLYTKLPIYTKRLDREQIIKILDKCNNVVKRLISKSKSTSGSSSHLREKIGQLIKENCWESSCEELSLAFMMGFTYYSPSKTKDTEQEEKNELKEGE
ncbi:MAG: hypothetical protein ACTSP3_01265 [Candidatus Heimdallarchaeaceae archaeon]